MKTEDIVARLPDVVQMRAASLGTIGETWVQQLLDLVDTLCTRWGCKPEAVLTGGSESLIITVNASHHGPAVMKLGLPESCDCVREAAVLNQAPAGSYVSCYAVDVDCNALLLEQLGPSIRRLDPGTRVELETIAELAASAWIRPTDTKPLTTGADKALWLINFIQERQQTLDRPCSDRVINLALRYAENRRAAFDPQKAVLIHGDAHEENTLSVTGSTPGHEAFRFVDPDGLLGEPAMELATLLRDWNADLLEGPVAERAGQRCRWLCDITGADETAAWEWGFIERVSTGLVMLEIGLTREAQECLNIAEQLATAS